MRGEIGVVGNLSLGKLRVYGALIIFSLALIILALPYVPWGFMRDDWGFLAYAIDHMKEWGIFFKPHNVVDFVNSGIIEQETLSWTGSFYRPLQFVLFALQYHFLETCAYFYLIAIVLMHATITTILFLVGSRFYSPLLALFAALLILLHPMIMLWIGVFTIQIYIMDVLYFLSITWFLKKFCDDSWWGWYIASGSLYFIALFAKESLILYPGWVFVAVIWYLSKIRPTYDWRYFLFSGLICSAGYALINGLYLAIRYIIFDGVVGLERKILGFASWSEFFQRQSERFYDLVTYVCNYLYVGTIPSGNKLFKFSLLLCILGLLIYPFWKQKQLLLLGFLTFSMLAVTWPAWLLYYHTRYAYIGLIFLYFIILFALDFYVDSYLFLKEKGWIIGGCILISLSYYADCMQRTKNNVLSMVTQATFALASEVHDKNKNVIFVGLPHYWFASGAGQLIKVFYPHFDRKCAVEGTSMLFGDREYGKINQHYVSIFRNEKAIHLQILPQEKMLFFLDAKNKLPIKSVVLEIEKDIAVLDSLIVTWDYRLHRFKILEAE